ncbi:MAG: hypothetical protein, partial [Olavius algarvensis Gamma 1 endosymbiont]
PGLKYTISATSFTMIEWATGRICAIFDEIFALRGCLGTHFRNSLKIGRLDKINPLF